MATVTPIRRRLQESVSESDLLRLIAVVVGGTAGYGTGRFLWLRRRVLLPPWPIIAVVALVGLVTLRLFGTFGLDTAWRDLFFPLVVGWGAGLAITPGRLPRRSLWWQLWKD